MTEQREGNALCPWCHHQLLNSQPIGVPITWRNALSLLHQTFWVVVLLLAAKCTLIAIILFLSSFTWFISHSCWGDECQTAWIIRTFICVIYIPSLGRYTDCLFLCFSSLHGLMCLNQNVTKAQAVTYKSREQNRWAWGPLGSFLGHLPWIVGLTSLPWAGVWLDWP